MTPNILAHSAFRMFIASGIPISLRPHSFWPALGTFFVPDQNIDAQNSNFDMHEYDPIAAINAPSTQVETSFIASTCFEIPCKKILICEQSNTIQTLGGLFFRHNKRREN